jgi:HAD superfamily hydrolase (TIGR01509 family)
VGARIEGWLEALAALGLPTTRDQVAPMIGMDGKRLAREIATAAGRTLDEHDVEAIDKAAGAAFDRLNKEPQPLPGVHDLLAALDRAGIPWVIATSSRKEQVTTSIKALELGQEPTIVDGSHVEHAKPAPDLLLLAAKRLGLPPAQCWGVGDATWDMRATGAAGMTAVGVTAGSAVSADALREAGAWLVVATLGDLVPRLR